MARDVVQLILWIVLGAFFTWGIFLSYIGFKSAPDYSRRRLARTAATISLVVGIFWIILWISAVVFNSIQILGAQ